jgi:hypothetical protein
MVCSADVVPSICHRRTLRQRAGSPRVKTGRYLLYAFDPGGAFDVFGGHLSKLCLGFIIHDAARVPLTFIGLVSQVRGTLGHEVFLGLGPPPA